MEVINNGKIVVTITYEELGKLVTALDNAAQYYEYYDLQKKAEQVQKMSYELRNAKVKFD
jgi:hypothetical protein